MLTLLFHWRASAYSPRLPRAMNQEKWESEQFLYYIRSKTDVSRGLLNLLYDVEESLSTVLVLLLWHFMAPGKRLTQHHSHLLRSGSIHGFWQTKGCMARFHTTGAMLSTGEVKQARQLAQAQLDMEKCSHWTVPGTYFTMTMFMFLSQSISSWRESRYTWIVLLRN